MKNDIITMNELTIAANRKFKDKRLEEATRKIATIYADAAKFVDTKNREIATILADVMETKAYEADGFKSVGDYAKEVFGINRQNAYSLASAGKVYNNPEAPAELKKMSPSKLVELSKVPAEQLEKDIASGKVTAAMTQKELREYSTSSKPSKVEVLADYTAHICAMSHPFDKAELAKARPIMKWDEFFLAYLETLAPIRKPEAIKLTKTTLLSDIEAKKATIHRMLYVCENASFVVEFYPKKESPKKAGMPKFTREELMRMLEALDD